MGKKHEGVVDAKLNLGGEGKRTLLGGGIDYGTYVRVQLKAGQSVSIVGNVTGAERQVRLSLLDPTGKTLTMTKGPSPRKTAELTFDEVNR